MSFTGTVKSFVASKGWGFIECSETFAHYGKDIFLLQSELGDGVADAGDNVSFSVVPGTKGPQAVNVVLAGRHGGGAVHAWKGSKGNGKGARAGNGMANGNGGGGGVGGFVGTVKSFNVMKGWGLIASDQVTQLYGKDMFFLKTSLPGGDIQVGAQVRFQVGQGRGGPEAQSIQIMGGAGPAWVAQRAAGPAWGQPAKGAGPSFFGGAPSFAPSFVASHFVARPPPAEQHLGVIKSFNEEKGWGHIECEEARQAYGKDVFIMRTALGGATCNVGDTVMFKCEVTPKGPRAAECTVLPQGSFGDGVSPSAVYSGTIKSFSEKKGWGFLTSEDTQQIFKKDIFVRKQEFDEGVVPSPGDPFQFTVTVGRTGRLEASSVMPLSGYQTQKMSHHGARASPY